MTQSEIFTEAWKIAKEANRMFGFYGGAKQYLNESIRLANKGFKASDLMDTRSIGLTDHFSGSEVEITKNLFDNYFLVDLTNGNKVVFKMYANLYFPSVESFNQTIKI